MSDFDWERDYGPIWRACPSAFWLAPEPGDRKRDVIDVRAVASPLDALAYGYYRRGMSLQSASYMQSALALQSYYPGSANYRRGPQSLLGNLLGF